ncbi:MAG TPA: hypothetical protein VG734_05630 [Lacunisphaera sp.]|nr:hypothetical protein [Lacunisphaera sp.]
MATFPRWLVSLVFLSGLAGLRAEVVTVNAQTFNRYKREQMPDGSFKEELYSFGEGGCWSRAMKDPWMDKLQFMDVARAVAAPLAKVNYRPALKTADAKLLILVFWGSTQGSSGIDHNNVIEQTGKAVSDYDRVANPEGKSGRLVDAKPVDARTPEGAAYENLLWQLGVGNRIRDELDEQNARILGYSEALDRARFALTTGLSRDVVEELANNRYYVVLQAYDFQAALKEKKLRPLWTTRLSVSETGKFGDALSRMIWSGNRYFGRNTDGLKREREAIVELPPIDFLEELSTPPPK